MRTYKYKCPINGTNFAAQNVGMDRKWLQIGLAY